MADYAGDEKALELGLSQNVEPDSVFDVRLPHIPLGSDPVFDDEFGAVVGYRYEGRGDICFYDLYGNVVGTQEKGLESPLIDPIDLLLVGGGAFRALGKGVSTFFSRSLLKAAALPVAKIPARTLAVSMLAAMRMVFKGISVNSLKFTATTASRMGVQGRYVPVHILQLAIKYGKREVDPQGVKGAFNYTIKMLRNGKEYDLEVVVRESDWTVLHFLYK